MSCRPLSERLASAESSTREPPNASGLGLRSDQLVVKTSEEPKTTNHRREDLQSDHTFYQFANLPRELQLMIWEHTWPASRVIEVAICEDKTADEYTDVAILRFASSLSSLLEVDFSSRIVEEGPLETIAPPVTLQVCQESRTHTLSRHRIMEHTKTGQGSFYFNACRDMLWLSFDVTDEPDYFRDLQRCYGEQLNAIETLLVEEMEWNESTPASYISNYLKPFKGLKSIVVLFSDNDEDSDVDIGEDVDEDSDEESGGDDSEYRNESGSQERESEARGLLARADEFGAAYAEFLEVHKESAKTIQGIDRSGTLY